MHKFRAMQRHVIHRERYFFDRADGTCCVAAKPVWNFLTVRHFYRRRLSRADLLYGTAVLNLRGNNMLNLVVTLLIIALVAAVLGFGGIASTAVGLAQVVFFVALVLFLIALVAGTMRGPRAL